MARRPPFQGYFIAGTGTAPSPPPRWPARYIDTAQSLATGTGTIPVMAYACGPDLLVLCNQKKYQSRLVDPLYYTQGQGFGTGTIQLWAANSQCCEYPPQLQMEFVEQSASFPLGISKHLEVWLCGVSSCPGIFAIIRCTYQPRSRTWTGSASIVTGTVQVTINVDPITPGLNLVLLGSCGPGTVVTSLYQDLVPTLCAYPFRSNVSPVLGHACCGAGCSSGKFAIAVLGYCKRRHTARLVDFEKAKFSRRTSGTGTGTFGMDQVAATGTGTLRQVWAFSECCLPACFAHGCCGVYEGCDLVMTLASSDCSCLNGRTATMTFNNVTSKWVGTVSLNGTCGLASVVGTLTCGTGPPGYTAWTLSVALTPLPTQGHCSCSGGSGPVTVQTLDTTSLSPGSCFPLDLTFAMGTATCTGGTPPSPPCACSRITLTVTVTLI